MPCYLSAIQYSNCPHTMATPPLTTSYSSWGFHARAFANNQKVGLTAHSTLQRMPNLLHDCDASVMSTLLGSMRGRATMSPKRYFACGWPGHLQMLKHIDRVGTRRADKPSVWNMVAGLVGSTKNSCAAGSRLACSCHRKERNTKPTATFFFSCSDLRMPRKCLVERTGSVWQVKYNIFCPVWSEAVTSCHKRS